MAYKDPLLQCLSRFSFTYPFLLAKGIGLEQTLLSCHAGPAFGTPLFITGCAQLVGRSLPACGAHTVPPRTGCKTSTHSSTASHAAASSAPSHASASSWSLPSWACTISSWHCCSSPPVYFLFPKSSISQKPLSSACIWNPYFITFICS